MLRKYMITSVLLSGLSLLSSCSSQPEIEEKTGRNIELGFSPETELLLLLQSVQFPHLECDELPLSIMCEYLTAQSRLSDPKGIGIEITVEVQEGAREPTVSMIVDDISLIDAILFTAQTTAYPFRVHGNKIVFSAGPAENGSGIEKLRRIWREHSANGLSEFNQRGSSYAYISKVCSSDVKSVVKGNTHFALNLYKKKAQSSQKNILISPFAVSRAMSMIYASKNTKAREDIKNTFHFPNDDQLYSGLSYLYSNITQIKDSDRRLFNQHHCLWLPSNKSINLEYIQKVRAQYPNSLQYYTTL